MRSFIFCLVVSASAASAQPADPLKSPECAQAIEALEQARTIGRQEPARAPQVEPLRRQAARVCLGARSTATPPSRVVRPPAAIAPPASGPPVRPPPEAAPAPAAQPRLHAPVITACDEGGCWDSDGTRLQRAGPNLIGPRGLCTLQGPLLNCP